VLEQQIQLLAKIYEAERRKLLVVDHSFTSMSEKLKFIDEALDSESKIVSWSETLKADLARGTVLRFDRNCIVKLEYRPFSSQWLYFDRRFNARVYQLPKIYPATEFQNLTICLTGIGESVGFSALMMNSLTEYKTIYNGQNFPRYLYEPATPNAGADDLFGQDGATNPDAPQYTRKDAITDAGLTHFTDAYPGETITKDDLFHYVYGILHSEDYRARYADNLSKQLPRIPLVKTANDFWAFVDAGVRLGDLHVNYENVAPYPVTLKEGDLALANIPDPIAYFRVEKMKYGGKRPNTDKTTVHYNNHITITGIPLAAYDYVVNGKSALDWVIDRQCVKTDKDSGIVSDANAYANETIGDPRYPFDLFCRVITVSLETMKVVNGLPALDIREG
jgi:predicted helicase